MCAKNAPLTPVRLANKTIRPRERGHTRADARTHTHAQRRARPVHVGIFQRITFSTFQNFTNLVDTAKTKKKLRVKIVLKNKVDPMHDTTNTCSCDGGVRATVPSETTLSRKLYQWESTQNVTCTAHTLSVRSSLRTRCRNKIMSCVLRRYPPKVRRNPSAHRSFVGFCRTQKDGSVVT